MSTEIQAIVEKYCPGSKLTGMYALDPGRMLETFQIAGPRLFAQHSSTMEFNGPEQRSAWIIEKLVSNLQREAITAYGLKAEIDRQVDEAVQRAVKAQVLKTLTVINRFQQSARAMGNTLELGILDQIANEI